MTRHGVMGAAAMLIGSMTSAQPEGQMVFASSESGEFGPRTSVAVYDTGTPSETGGGFAGPGRGGSTYDDVTFGNFAAEGDVWLTGASVGFWYPSGQLQGTYYGRIGAFFAAFEGGNACGDQDGDTDLDLDDIAAFFTGFEAGGC